MEDVLTGAVLGSLQYLPAAACWTPLLAAARRLDGETLGLPPLPEGYLSHRFWPRWAHADGRITEPDLVLRWPGALLAVEVKYLSGKSSEASEDPTRVTDQLARQLERVNELGLREGRAAGVLYLTADPVLPRRALADSLAELRTKRSESGSLAWVSWTHLREVLAAWTPGSEGEARLQHDLVAHLSRLGFVGFHGIAARPPVPPAWCMGRRLVGTLPPVPPAYRFERRP